MTCEQKHGSQWSPLRRCWNELLYRLLVDLAEASMNSEASIELQKLNHCTVAECS